MPTPSKYFNATKYYGSFFFPLIHLTCNLSLGEGTETSYFPAPPLYHRMVPKNSNSGTSKVYIFVDKFYW